MQDLNNGTFIVATLQAFESEPWKNDPTKFNNRLSLCSTYEDRYGNESHNYTYVNVQGDDVQRMHKFGRENQGKRVVVPVIMNLKSGTSQQTGKPYAFIDTYMPKGTEILVLDKVSA